MGCFKHKDRDPRDTVGPVRSVLRDAGLQTDLRWTSRGVASLRSCRVAFAGTNCKGTSEEHASASGLAEFMECPQHNIPWC